MTLHVVPAHRSKPHARPREYRLTKFLASSWKMPTQTHKHFSATFSKIILSSGRVVLHSGTKTSFFLRRGFLQNVRLSWLWCSQCQLYCWGHHPWVFFVSLPVTQDSTETPFARTPFLAPDYHVFVTHFFVCCLSFGGVVFDSWAGVALECY